MSQKNWKGIQWLCLKLYNRLEMLMTIMLEKFRWLHMAITETTVKIVQHMIQQQPFKSVQHAIIQSGRRWMLMHCIMQFPNISIQDLDLPAFQYCCHKCMGDICKRYTATARCLWDQFEKYLVLKAVWLCL